MNREQALKEINDTQDFYVHKLIDIIKGVDHKFEHLKEIDFTSPTGTGKTIMVAKIIESLPDYFFIVTSLSKGQLKVQVKNKIDSLLSQNNYVVFGLNDLTRHSKLKEAELLKLLGGKKVIWIRDEGHIATNRWFEVLSKISCQIINFSATNLHNNGIQCNFMHTMMLRTVVQSIGSPSEALDKLLEVKKTHANVLNYNPCALFRILNDENLSYIIRECEKRKLKYINITDEDFDMTELCEDSNEYDVIINKLKITEGIDLRRCHVIYIDNKPKKESTIIQVIGRARRNALFWRNDIDILDANNKTLLGETTKCYVFYNVENSEIKMTENGEFLYSLCDKVSVEALKPNITIDVQNGKMQNGLTILELVGKTGSYRIEKDCRYGMNVVNNKQFYEFKCIDSNDFVLDLTNENLNLRKIYFKRNVVDAFKINDRQSARKYDSAKRDFLTIKLYCERVENIVDIPYWENYLEMSNKRRLVPAKKWGEFIYGPDTPRMSHIIYSEKKPWITREDEELFEQYCLIDKTPQYSDALNLFERSYLYDEYQINPNLWKYIEKAEFKSFDNYIRIGRSIENNNKVKAIEFNKYKYAPHYFTDYLKNHGITSLQLLSDKINSTRTFAIYGATVRYWKEMLLNVKEFNDIDDYDTKTVNLYELNRILNLGFTERTIRECISETSSSKIVTNFMNKFVFGFDKHKPLKRINPRTTYKLHRNIFINSFEPYRKIINDFEIGLIGTDTMKMVKTGYVEDTAVTSKLSSYSKLSRFISEKYKKIFEDKRKMYFSEENKFKFDRKCNSCLGFCVEYFAKIKLYGDDTYRFFIKEALREAKTTVINDIVRVRAAMLIYVSQMQSCYGSSVTSVIPTIRIERLIEKNYESFVNTVAELGNKAASFIEKKLYSEKGKKPEFNVDPILSVNHMSALCDFITKDTILDLKCTSSITEKHLEQVLSYYYLSTKRSDLRINRLIIYDAVTGKYIQIDLEDNKLNELFWSENLKNNPIIEAKYTERIEIDKEKEAKRDDLSKKIAELLG